MTALSKTGARRLAEAEAKIERGLSTFMEVGTALQQIRDERLYREQHDTFEVYCRQRWGFSSRRANQLMDAVEIGTIVPVANEGQARALSPIKSDPHEVREVYAEAEQRGDTTAAGIARVMAERKPPANVDPETGEITEGEAMPLATGSGAGEGVAPGQTREAPSASPSVPPVDPTLGYRARARAEESKIREGLLTLDPERVVQTSDEPDHWRQFSADVRDWLDTLDGHLSGPALKAVQ